MYFPLHCHSHYSLLDGLSSPSQLANRVKHLGLSGCALTDHGNISGSVAFTKEMKKNMNEDITDTGGYFITNGKEYVITALENITFVSNPTISDLLETDFEINNFLKKKFK